jgi:soluble lytic murein transglycosylase-like protein
VSLVSVVGRIAEIETMLAQTAPGAVTPTAPASSAATTGASFSDALQQASAAPPDPSTGSATSVSGSDVTPAPETGTGATTGSLAGVPYGAEIAAAAQKYGVDPDLIRAVIEHESGFDRNATSPVGAQGLMQLMPRTARGLGVSDSYDPVQNIDGGTHFLADLLHRFNGDTRLALAAYDAGPTAVERYHGVPPYAETQNYVTWVLNRLAELKGQSTSTTERSSS